MPRNVSRIIADLYDAPAEALAVALADAVYGLSEASQSGFALYVNEADAILERLRARGFDIVAAPLPLSVNTFRETSAADRERNASSARDRSSPNFSKDIYKN